MKDFDWFCTLLAAYLTNQGARSGDVTEVECQRLIVICNLVPRAFSSTIFKMAACRTPLWNSGEGPEDEVVPYTVICCVVV